MNIQFNISNAGFFFFLLIIFSSALVYAVYFFRKSKEEFTPTQRYLLSAIKFIYVFLAAIILLVPVIETVRNRIEKPILVIGVDNSESMNVDSTNGTVISEYLDEVTGELSQKYQVETLLFGDKTTRSDAPDFSYQKSNYSGFFTELDKRYFNLNVGAVVLLGDGIYNEGTNPSQYSSRIDAPVYAIGFGDTLSRLDQAIVDVTHNPNVFLNNSFPVEIELSFTEFTQSLSQLSIYIDGKLEQSQNIEVPQPDFYFKKVFDLKATEVGLKNVEVVLSSLTDEQNKRNNRYRFTIEVHDNKQQILVLSQGPHPDIGVLTQTLDQKANFNITQENINLFQGDVSKYDLVVLNQLPSLRSQHLEIFAQLKTAKVPLMVIVGPTTSISALNNLQLGFKLNPTLVTEESAPYFDLSFSLFNLPTNIKDIEKIYPPLLTHFTEYEFSNNYSVLAYQRINDIEMNYPLIMAGEIDGRKCGVLMGEGIWRWKIHEYQNYNNQDVFNQIVVNLFNYLCLKEERDQFRIQYERICNETTPVKLKAQLFNDIFEPVANAEIKLLLTDSTNRELSYLFDAGDADYTLNLGFLEPGSYQFEARTELGENEFVKKGSFSVQEVNIEHQNLQSNFKVMNFIAQKTGGDFYLKDSRSQLIDELKNKDDIRLKVHKEKNIVELVDWKWFILCILLLLSLEWFLRKFWGSY